MECFEQSRKLYESVLEKKVKKSIESIADSDKISNFKRFAGDNSISFEVKDDIDKFHLNAIKKATGYKLNSVDLINNKMVVILEK